MPDDPNANTLVVVRHGIFSDSGAMANLESYLFNKFPGCLTGADPNYRWQDPILHSGVELAELVLRQVKATPAIDKIIFAGHSQGGLVCRVAVAALCAHAKLLASVRLRQGSDPSYFEHAATQLLDFSRLYVEEMTLASNAVHSILMLGTPNCGAFTNGQLALQGTIALKTAKKIASLGGWKNFDELTTEKLFRLLQNLDIRRVRYVSISGSSFNRYKAMGWSSLSAIPLVSRLAPALELPNDWVVEDSSVDLSKAPLPTEVGNLNKQYTHIRAYTECILTSHTSIHSDPTVFAALDAVLGWS